MSRGTSRIDGRKAEALVINDGSIDSVRTRLDHEFFIPGAVVYHSHPDTLWKYLKKKYKFVLWRILAVRNNPEKALRDSHTHQVMKFQLLFAPVMVLAIAADLVLQQRIPATLLVCIAFLVSTLPFAW